MIFHETEPNINIDLLNWRSESGQFELGFRRVMYGCRVSLSDVAGGCYPIDYCLGLNTIQGVMVLSFVRHILYSVPDTDPVKTRRALKLKGFPIQVVKPIESDPETFAALLRMTTASGYPAGSLDGPSIQKRLVAALERSTNDLIAELARVNEQISQTSHDRAS